MSQTRKRLFLLCAHRSVREIMAASLIAAYARDEWDIWMAPGHVEKQEMDLVRHVLNEIHIPLLDSPHTIEPSFDLSWDEGIVICDGATNQ